MMTRDDDMSELARALDNLDGYVTFGPRYCPCAAYFTLVTLDSNGETDGGGADVCRDCVTSVARQAAAVVRGDAPYDPYVGERGLGRIANPESWGGAMVVAGLAVAYELYGETDSHSAGYNGETTACAECGAPIE